MNTNNEVLGMEGCNLTPTEWDREIKKARVYHLQGRSSGARATSEQRASSLPQEGKRVTE